MIITFFQISQGNLIKRYSSQQEENVWDQLLYGIRYLDFRVSYHANTAEKFWLNHDLIQMNPLYKAIQVLPHFPILYFNVFDFRRILEENLA